MSAEEINNNYRNLCAELGHIAFRRMELQGGMAMLQQEAEALDKKAQELNQKRVELAKAMEELQKGAGNVSAAAG